MPRSVLLVESDKDLAETVKDMLVASGYPVTVFDDDSRALGAMHGIRFALLITTLRRCAATSLTFAQEAKLLLPNLRIMAITGAGQDESFGDDVFDAILHKPFDIATLAMKVSALMSNGFENTEVLD